MRGLRWKLDLTILPIFLVTQALQFMDKTSLNYADLFGYQKGLDLKGQKFNYLSASMYVNIGCSSTQILMLLPRTVPWQVADRRYSAQKVMAVSIPLWGATVIIMTQCQIYFSACKKVTMKVLYTQSTGWGQCVSDVCGDQHYNNRAADYNWCPIVITGVSEPVITP